MHSSRRIQTGPILLCAFLFVATEMLGSMNLGPLSIRNYCLLLVLVALFFRRTTVNRTVLSDIKYLIFYYLFVVLLGFFNGLYEESGAFLVFTRFLPSIIIYVFVASYLDDETKMIQFAYALLGIMFIDAIITILQGTGNSFSWAITSFINKASSEFLDDVTEISLGRSLTPGLIGTAVANGTFLAMSGLLFWVPFFRQRTLFSLLVSLSLFSLCVVALYYNQQRMAFYIYLLFSALIMLYISPSHLLRVLLVLCLIGIGWLFSYKFNQLELGRLSDVSNREIGERHILHKVYYELFFPNHMFTGDRTQFIATYGTTPHNIIIDTLLLGGIGGLIIYLFFALSYLRKSVKLYFNSNRQAFLFSIPILVSFLISWEHSTGFHTGLTTGMYFLALFECSRKNQSSAN